jgi:hypothetical protein
MQDQIADPVGGDGAPQQSTRAKDGFLADEILQTPGPEPFGQGGQPCQVDLSLVAKQVAHGSLRQWHPRHFHRRQWHRRLEK